MKKRNNIISLTLNAFIFVSTLICLIYIMVFGVLGNMEGTGSQALIYFTIQSNIFASLTSLAYLFFNIKTLLKKEVVIPSILKIIKYTSCVAVMLTFLTVLLFLGPFSPYGFIELFKGTNFFFHFFTPILAFITFVFFEDSFLSKKVELLAIIPTACYSINYFINVIITKKWVDFYGFTFGGKYYLIPIVVVVMYGVSFLIGLGTSRLSRLIKKGSLTKM